MASTTVNGEAAMAINLTRPNYGAWVADVSLSGAKVPTGLLTLKTGALSLKGTARRGKAYGGQTKLRIVGGYDGWRKVLPAKGYSLVAGVRLSHVLNDAAREAGEKISIPADRFIGTHFARERGKAEHVLRMLTGGAWWVDDEGVTQVRERDSSAISTPFTVTNRDPAKGIFEVATEAPQDWVPGRTFSSPTTPDVQTISSVSIRSGNEGAMRLAVTTVDPDRERLLASFRAIVREEFANFSYNGVWEYEVLSGTSAALELRSLDQRMPNLSRVPSIPGLMGEEVTPAPLSKAYVAFANMDPTKPKCIGIEGNPLLIKLDYTLLQKNSGARPTARMGDLAGIFPIVATGIDELGT